MLQAVKVWIFRKYYRYISARGWRGLLADRPASTVQIPGATGTIAARVYPGKPGSERPLIVYFHGGGWVIGDLDTHHPYCQVLSHRSGCSVVAVDYRLAPEHPFPAGPDDCLAATRWISEHSSGLAPSNGKLVIAGDSAGANLATATCLELEPTVREQIVGEVIKYPVVDHYSANPLSYTERARGQALTSKLMRWFWDTYLANTAADDPTAKRAMPLSADGLDGLPPTFLITAEYDPLRDEGLAYAGKLRAAGVALQHRHFARASHGFACSEGPNEDFEDFMNELVDWLRQLS